MGTSLDGAGGNCTHKGIFVIQVDSTSLLCIAKDSKLDGIGIEARFVRVCIESIQSCMGFVSSL